MSVIKQAIAQLYIVFKCMIWTRMGSKTFNVQILLKTNGFWTGENARLLKTCFLGGSFFPRLLLSRLTICEELLQMRGKRDSLYCQEKCGQWWSLRRFWIPEQETMALVQTLDSWILTTQKNWAGRWLVGKQASQKMSCSRKEKKHFQSIPIRACSGETCSAGMHCHKRAIK